MKDASHTLNMVWKRKRTKGILRFLDASNYKVKLKKLRSLGVEQDLKGKIRS